MGLAGLALIPVGAVNKLTIDATPSEARAGYNGALAWLVFLIPLFQAFWWVGPLVRGGVRRPAHLCCALATGSSWAAHGCTKSVRATHAGARPG